MAHATTPTSPTAPTTRLATRIADPPPLSPSVVVAPGGGGGAAAVVLGDVGGGGALVVVVAGGGAAVGAPTIWPSTDAAAPRSAGKPAALYTPPMLCARTELRACGLEAAASSCGESDIHWVSTWRSPAAQWT